MSMQIISTSNIKNNPPAITNNPLQEVFLDAKNIYANSQRDIFRREIDKENRIDNFMTMLFVTTSGLVIFALTSFYNGSKKSILNKINFLTNKTNIAKTFITQHFSQFAKNVKK